MDDEAGDTSWSDPGDSEADSRGAKGGGRVLPRRRASEWRVNRASRPKPSHRDGSSAAGGDGLASERDGGSGGGTGRSHTTQSGRRLGARRLDGKSGRVSRRWRRRGGAATDRALGGRGCVKLRRDKHKNSLFTPRDEELLKRTQREKKLLAANPSGLAPGKDGGGGIGSLGGLKGEGGAEGLGLAPGMGLERVTAAEAPRVQLCVQRLMAKASTSPSWCRRVGRDAAVDGGRPQHARLADEPRAARRAGSAGACLVVHPRQ